MRSFMTIKFRLTILVTLFLVGFLFFAGLVFSTFQTYKINGSVYKDLVLGKDLVADFLPPPEYIIESHLLAHQMATITDRNGLQQLVEHSRRLKREYEDRHAFWEKELPSGSFKKAATSDCYRPAMEYFRILEEQFIPAVETGNREKSRGLVEGELDRRFREHQQAIEQVIQLANERNAEIEANAAHSVRDRIVLVATLTCFLMATVICLSIWIVRGITRPLSKTVQVLRAVSGGDLRSRLSVDSHDEIGLMGQALNEALENMSRALEAIDRGARKLATSSARLSEISQSLSSASEETAAQAGVVSSATEQVNNGIHTVSAGSEEMSATICEIARNAAEAAKVAAIAVAVADQTNTTVAQLGESSAEIGGVLKVITSIAGQTNLLALNATIEAARAGEAGKGFAVVANEVKELAKQTALATEDIGHKIEAIQKNTYGAVQAIDQIGTIIKQINEIQANIASAVEEQTATTSEMSRNMQESAMGSGEINRIITDLVTATRDTSDGVSETRRAAVELAELAVDLQKQVGRFQYKQSGEAASDDVHSARPGENGSARMGPGAGRLAGFTLQPVAS